LRMLAQAPQGDQGQMALIQRCLQIGFGLGADLDGFHSVTFVGTVRLVRSLTSRACEPATMCSSPVTCGANADIPDWMRVPLIGLAIVLMVCINSRPHTQGPSPTQH